MYVHTYTHTYIQKHTYTRTCMHVKHREIDTHDAYLIANRIFETHEANHDQIRFKAFLVLGNRFEHAIGDLGVCVCVCVYIYIYMCVCVCLQRPRKKPILDVYMRTNEDMQIQT